MKDVFDVTFQSALDVFNYGLVLIYGLFLSVSIAGGCAPCFWCCNPCLR